MLRESRIIRYKHITEMTKMESNPVYNGESMYKNVLLHFSLSLSLLPKTRLPHEVERKYDPEGKTNKLFIKW